MYKLFLKLAFKPVKICAMWTGFEWFLVTVSRKHVKSSEFTHLVWTTRNFFLVHILMRKPSRLCYLGSSHRMTSLARIALNSSPPLINFTRSSTPSHLLVKYGVG